MIPDDGSETPKADRGFRALIQQAQAGDRDAMDEIFDLLWPMLERTARRSVGAARPEESTMDLVQKSCLLAWTKIDTFQGAGSDEETLAAFRGWMGQIIRRQGIQTHRKKAARAERGPEAAAAAGASLPRSATVPGAPVEPIAPQSGPLHRALSAERDRQVSDALDRMSDPVDARIIRLHFFEGMTLDGIATRLDVPFAEVRRRYRVAMRLLEQLKDRS